jgi:F0F1-type ATP synthase membrane subunit b/b'
LRFNFIINSCIKYSFIQPITIIEERKEYILTNLGKASEILAEANKLTTQYEEELANVRREAQLEITNSQKFIKKS